MKYLVTLAFFILYTFNSYSQYVSYQDGSPAREIKLVNVEGSELLYPDWTKGSIKLASGRVYDEMLLKYNIYEDQLYFQGKDNATMKFTSTVVEFRFGSDVYRNGYPAIKDFNELSYFKVLSEGKATLLKKITKNVIDVKEFNSSITVKKIADDKIYYLFNNGKMLLLKSDKATFLGLVSDKKSEIEAYLKANKINFKKEEDLIALVTAYNKL